MVSPGINIIFFAFFIIVISFPNSSIAESDYFNSTVDSLLKEITSLSSDISAQRSSEDCPQEYQYLHTYDRLRVSIFLGVIETYSGASWDRPAKYSLIKHLTKKCGPNYFACGFSQENTEQTVLQKTTVDSQNIIINIHDSSVSERFSPRNIKLLSEQQSKSEEVTSEFLKSIERDDIVFYIGHSRYGTGPGFYYLPFLSSQWRSTYVHSPLLSATIRTLEHISDPPKILGIFSCSSQRYYAKKIHSAAPDMALIVSDGITEHPLNVAEAVNALNIILGNLCYSKSDNTSIKLNKNSAYTMYGLFGGNFPQFKKHNSLFLIIIFTLILPVLIIVTSKIFSIKTFTPYETKAYVKDTLLLMILSLISLMLTILFSKLYTDADEQSIPLFFILTGALFLVTFSCKQKKLLNRVIKTFKSSAVSLFFSILIYFVINFFPAEDINQLTMATIQSVKFLLIFSVLLPFVIFSTGILTYPLYGEPKLHLVKRILLFVTISGIFYIVISYSVTQLNVYLPPYIIAILLFFLHSQFISLLLFYYRSSTLLSIIYQTLALALIFSENIHSLYY